MAGARLQQEQDTVRIPLYANEDQRQYASESGAPSREMRDQLFVNCYPVPGKNPLAPDQASLHMQSRLGWSYAITNVDLTNDDSTVSGVVTNTSAAYVKAVMTMSGLSDVIAVCYVDGTNFRFVQYRPSAGTCRLLGTVAFGSDYASSSFVHLSELSIGINNVPYLGVVISDETTRKSKAYYCASSSGTLTASGLTAISDVNFPTEIGTPKLLVGPMVQLNENIYVMTQDGLIYNSELDTDNQAQVVNWYPDSYVSCSSYNDKGVGLVRYKHHLVAFGKETVEFFNDEGNPAPDSPLAPTQQAFIKIGAVNQTAYRNVDDTLWWVSYSSTGQISLYKLEGYTPVQISSPSMAKVFADRPYYINLQVTTMHGLKHLVLNCLAYGRYWFDDGTLNGDTLVGDGTNFMMQGNLCFCPDTGAWWLWASEHDYENDTFGYETLFFNTMDISNNIIKFCWSNIRSISGGFTYGLHPRRAFAYFEGSNAEGWYDAYNLNNDSQIDSYRIPVMISTGYYDFGTNKRKFLRSIEVIADKIVNYNPSALNATNAIDTITRSGTTVTVTTVDDHLLSTGNDVWIAGGAVQFADYNGYYVITVTGAKTFTYQIATTPTSPAIGTFTWRAGEAPWDAFNAEGLNFTLGFTRVDNLGYTDPPEIIRAIDMITYPDQRIRFTNFGAFRKGRIIFCVNTYVPLRFEALELTLAQGTH